MDRAVILRAAFFFISFAAGLGWWAVVPFLDGRRMGASDWWRRRVCAWLAATSVLVGLALLWAASEGGI